MLKRTHLICTLCRKVRFVSVYGMTEGKVLSTICRRTVRHRKYNVGNVSAYSVTGEKSCRKYVGIYTTITTTITRVINKTTAKANSHCWWCCRQKNGRSDLFVLYSVSAVAEIYNMLKLANFLI